MGLPCDIQTLLQAHCTTCHGSPLVGGAPVPLLTFANLTAISPTYPGMTFAQRAFTRMQAVVGQMPPAPNVRATAVEIQAMGTWIAAGYPMGSCGGTVTGSGGTPGTTITTGAGGATGVTGTGGRVGVGTGGAVGTTGTGGAPAVVAGGLPCDVQTVFSTHCTTCHAATPVSGVPMSLVTYANLRATSTTFAPLTYAQRAVTRMQDNVSPMPPVPGTRTTAAEVATVNNWIAAGYPTGTCGTTSTGAGGAGGVIPIPNPFTAAPVCTSKTFWTGGNNGNVLMNPGRACINCHANGGGGDDDENEAPIFALAGTVYPTAHEPDLCNGVNGTNGARVVIVDAANRTITLTPNAAGNFTYAGALTKPFHAKVTYQGRERIMTAAQTTGDCNSCHTQNGANGAPGRILLP